MNELASRPSQEELERQLATLHREGYVVLPAVIDEQQCAAIREESERLLSFTGRNPFEGHKTQRVYSPLAKTRAIDVLVDHPRVLALLDALLMPNYLLSQAQIINLLPGEAAQPLHHDDAFYPLPRPFRPVHAAFICAIDRFTVDNGATVVVPKSHAWGGERVPERSEVVACEMDPGSLVFFLGTLWHGGGANQTERARLAVTCQYCDPWLRQHENFFLEIPREQAVTLRESILALLGYSIHPPFMGMVDGRHPRRALDRDE